MSTLIKKLDKVDNAKLTMSSLEIAELTGKEHRNITRDIERMLLDLELSALNFEGSYKDGRNNNQKLYNLPRRETDILISGYSVKYRAAIIDRWYALEEENKKLRNKLIEDYEKSHKLDVKCLKKEIQRKASALIAKNMTLDKAAALSNKVIDENSRLKEEIKKVATPREHVDNNRIKELEITVRQLAKMLDNTN